LIGRRFGSLSACLALAATALAGPAAAQSASDPTQSRGPIPIRDSRPFNLLFLQFVPESADTLRSRANRYDLQFDIANNTLIPNPGGGTAVVEDNEYQRLRFAWRHGLDSRTELAAFTSLEWRDGGILDGIIKAYHHLLGIAANSDDVPLGRDHFPLYQSKLEIVDTANGHALVDQGNAIGLGETMVTLKRRLTAGAGRGAIAVRIAVKAPTGNPTLLLGSGRFDAGATIDGRYNLGRDVTLYGNLGYALLGRAGRVPSSRPNTVETLAALEYHPNHRDDYVLQVDGNGDYVLTGNSFADRSNVTLTFGYRRVIDRKTIAHISISESGHLFEFNAPSIANIGPEFTLSTGVTLLR